MGIKFTEDEKIQFVEDWRTSGLNKKKYAEQNGLVYNSFKTWKDKTKETQKKKLCRDTFYKFFTRRENQG